MISFACTNVKLQEVITCSFELNRTEYELLIFLLEQENALTVTEIADKQGFERSTVQKAISRLLSKALVERRQLNLSGGGYRFLYAVTEKEEIRKRLHTIVEGWYKNVLGAIDKW